MLSIKALLFGHNFKIIRFLIPFSQGLQGRCFHSSHRVTFGTIRKALNKMKIQFSGKCDWKTLNGTDWNMTTLTSRWVLIESRILITLPSFTTVSGSFRKNCSMDSFLPKCHTECQFKIHFWCNRVTVNRTKITFKPGIWLCFGAVELVCSELYTECLPAPSIVCPLPGNTVPGCLTMNSSSRLSLTYFCGSRSYITYITVKEW